MAELSKTYDPKTVEPKWYQRWIHQRDFEADAASKKKPFSIVMPPPNITGVLTLGHVLNNSIQDILARGARMRGFEVLWLPGMDHAGIGTQTAVEKWLRKNEGVTRHDLGREKFLQRVLEWQDKHGGIIIQQLKRLGCSCDWSRQRYTFDDNYVCAIEKIFVDLYKKKLIYRGRRMINWDPAAQTALSDEEVINKPQKGNLYYARYEIVEQPGKFLEVATTRPETIMADTGVAVHSKDKRYADLVGKEVWRPMPREKIPVVADDAIDPEFGTGVLKVTPAHDKVDFEVGQRHKLPVIDVLHPNGKINCSAATRTMLASATAAMSRSSRDLASSGFCIIRKRRKRSRLLKNISSASSRSIGRKFTSNGSRTFRTGASADKFGGDIEFQRGIAEMKPAFRSHLRAKVGRNTKTRLIPGFRPGFGLTRRWTRKRGRNFIRRPCW